MSRTKGGAGAAAWSKGHWYQWFQRWNHWWNWCWSGRGHWSNHSYPWTKSRAPRWRNDSGWELEISGV